MRPIIGEVRDDGATPRPRRRARARRLRGQEGLEGQGDETAERVRKSTVWAFSAQTRNWTNLIADADEPQIQAAAGLPACLANDSVQLAIALVVAFLVTGAALRARFRHDDAYDGPPGVQASPYVGVA